MHINAQKKVVLIGSFDEPRTKLWEIHHVSFYLAISGQTC